MKHTVKVGEHERTFSDEMKVGEIAIITGDDQYRDHVVARIYHEDDDVVHLVSLNDPGATWEGDTFRVRILSPGTDLRITVGDCDE